MNDLFSLLFEFFGTLPATEVRDALYNLVYVPAGFILIFTTLLWTILYYQGFFLWRRQAKYDTRVSWLLWMLISSAITTIVVWILTISVFQKEQLEYATSNYLDFLCMVLLWSTVMYFLYSLGGRFLNPGRRKIPF